MEYSARETGSRKGKGGPRTAAGKARSALNAVTHGLTAHAPVALWFETEEAWATFRAGIIASLSPVGEGERNLAEKIALTLWRQNRVAAYETHRTNLALSTTPGEVERDLRSDHTEADAEARMRAKLTERLLLGDLELLKLQRYESHLGRELSRLFKHLHQLQDRRTQPRHAAAANPSPAAAPPETGLPPAGGIPGAGAAPTPTAQSPAGPATAPDSPGTRSAAPPSSARTEQRSLLQNELRQPTPLERLTGVDHGSPTVRMATPSWSGTSIPNACSHARLTSTSCIESSRSKPKSVAGVSDASSPPFASATVRRTHCSIS